MIHCCAQLLKTGMFSRCTKQRVQAISSSLKANLGDTYSQLMTFTAFCINLLVYLDFGQKRKGCISTFWFYQMKIHIKKPPRDVVNKVVLD